MASGLGTAASTLPQPRLLSLVAHIKLNGFANAAFRFTPSCLATLLPAPSTPGHSLCFPSQIDWTANRPAWIIHTLPGDKPISAPAKSRKKRSDRHASDETEEDVDVYSANKERVCEGRTNGEGEQRGTRTRVWRLGGQLTLPGRSSNELRRRLISSFDPMTWKIRPRKKIDEYAPRVTALSTS